MTMETLRSFAQPLIDSPNATAVAGRIAMGALGASVVASGILTSHALYLRAKHRDLSSWEGDRNYYFTTSVHQMGLRAVGLGIITFGVLALSGPSHRPFVAAMVTFGLISALDDRRARGRWKSGPEWIDELRTLRWLNFTLWLNPVDQVWMPLVNGTVYWMHVWSGEQRADLSQLEIVERANRRTFYKPARSWMIPACSVAVLVLSALPTSVLEKAGMHRISAFVSQRPNVSLFTPLMHIAIGTVVVQCLVWAARDCYVRRAHFDQRLSVNHELKRLLIPLALLLVPFTCELGFQGVTSRLTLLGRLPYPIVRPLSLYSSALASVGQGSLWRYAAALTVHLSVLELAHSLKPATPYRLLDDEEKAKASLLAIDDRQLAEHLNGLYTKITSEQVCEVDWTKKLWVIKHLLPSRREWLAKEIPPDQALGILQQIFSEPLHLHVSYSGNGVGDLQPFWLDLWQLASAKLGEQDRPQIKALKQSIDQLAGKTVDVGAKYRGLNVRAIVLGLLLHNGATLTAAEMVWETLVTKDERSDARRGMIAEMFALKELHLPLWFNNAGDVKFLAFLAKTDLPANVTVDWDCCHGEKGKLEPDLAAVFGAGREPTLFQFLKHKRGFRVPQKWWNLIFPADGSDLVIPPKRFAIAIGQLGEDKWPFVLAEAPSFTAVVQLYQGLRRSSEDGSDGAKLKAILERKVLLVSDQTNEDALLVCFQRGMSKQLLSCWESRGRVRGGEEKWASLTPKIRQQVQLSLSPGATRGEEDLAEEEGRRLLAELSPEAIPSEWFDGIDLEGVCTDSALAESLKPHLRAIWTSLSSSDDGSKGFLPSFIRFYVHTHGQAIEGKLDETQLGDGFPVVSRVDPRSPFKWGWAEFIAILPAMSDEKDQKRFARIAELDWSELNAERVKRWDLYGMDKLTFSLLKKKWVGHCKAAMLNKQPLHSTDSVTDCINIATAFDVLREVALAITSQIVTGRVRSIEKRWGAPLVGEFDATWKKLWEIASANLSEEDIPVLRSMAQSLSDSDPADLFGLLVHRAVTREAAELLWRQLPPVFEPDEFAENAFKRVLFKDPSLNLPHWYSNDEQIECLRFLNQTGIDFDHLDSDGLVEMTEDRGRQLTPDLRQLFDTELEWVFFGLVRTAGSAPWFDRACWDHLFPKDEKDKQVPLDRFMRVFQTLSAGARKDILINAPSQILGLRLYLSLYEDLQTEMSTALSELISCETKGDCEGSVSLLVSAFREGQGELLINWWKERVVDLEHLTRQIEQQVRKTVAADAVRGAEDLSEEEGRQLLTLLPPGPETAPYTWFKGVVLRLEEVACGDSRLIECLRPHLGSIWSHLLQCSDLLSDQKWDWLPWFVRLYIRSYGGELTGDIDQARLKSHFSWRTPVGKRSPFVWSYADFIAILCAIGEEQDRKQFAAIAQVDWSNDGSPLISCEPFDGLDSHALSLVSKRWAKAFKAWVGKGATVTATQLFGYVEIAHHVGELERLGLLFDALAIPFRQYGSRCDTGPLHTECDKAKATMSLQCQIACCLQWPELFTLEWLISLPSESAKRVEHLLWQPVRVAAVEGESCALDIDPPPLPRVRGPHQRLAQAYKDGVLEACADLSLEVGKKTFRLHKAILCAHSDYWDALLSKSWNDSEVTEVDASEMADSDTIERYIHYLYTGEIDLEESDGELLSALGKLLLLAKDTRTEQLRRDVVRQMIPYEPTSPAQLVALINYALAVKLEAPDLWQHALHCFAADKVAIKGTSEWRVLEGGLSIEDTLALDGAREKVGHTDASVETESVYVWPRRDSWLKFSTAVPESSGLGDQKTIPSLLAVGSSKLANQLFSDEGSVTEAVEPIDAEAFNTFNEWCFAGTKFSLGEGSDFSMDLAIKLTQFAQRWEATAFGESIERAVIEHAVHGDGTWMDLINYAIAARRTRSVRSILSHLIAQRHLPAFEAEFSSQLIPEQKRALVEALSN